MTRKFVVVLLVVTAGCAPGIESQLAELAASRETWMSAVPSQTYSFDFVRYCFCPNSGRVTHIDVENAALTHFSGTSDTDPVVDLDQVPTIQSIQDDILRFIERSVTEGSKLTIHYDEMLGYPTLIEWKSNRTMDTDIQIQISNVVVK